MEKLKTKKNPEFLVYVYKLNEGIELKEALKLSLEKINEVDIAQIELA